MGNTPSSNTPSSKKDHEPEQQPEKGMREIGFPLGQKIHLGGPFFIEGGLNNGIYGFYLYHLDSLGIMTTIFLFETFHQLRDAFKVVYKGSLVKFVFETDSFEKGLKHVLEFAFDFSKSFHSEKDSNQPLKSIPYPLPPDGKIIHLEGKYSYFVISIGNSYEFMIVESPNETERGFESVFKEGDVVIQIMNVKSSNFPYVMNDEKGNLVIVSADEGFVPIPIQLPSDNISLAVLLSQENFP